MKPWRILSSRITYRDFAAYDFDGPKQTHHAAALFYAERYFNRHPDRRPQSR